MTNKERNKIRAKRKKVERRQEAMNQWISCCSTNLVEWSCYCSFGCECCDIRLRCSVCHRAYRDKDIQSLKTRLQ